MSTVDDTRMIREAWVHASLLSTKGQLQEATMAFLKLRYDARATRPCCLLVFLVGSRAFHGEGQLPPPFALRKELAIPI